MPSWAARQILDCAVEACDPLFRVELAESDPRGAALSPGLRSPWCWVSRSLAARLWPGGN